MRAGGGAAWPGPTAVHDLEGLNWPGVAGPDSVNLKWCDESGQPDVGVQVHHLPVARNRDTRQRGDQLRPGGLARGSRAGHRGPQGGGSAPAAVVVVANAVMPAPAKAVANIRRRLCLIRPLALGRSLTHWLGQLSPEDEGTLPVKECQFGKVIGALARPGTVTHRGSAQASPR